MANDSQSILALDYGEKRIGLALADTQARLPHPAGVIQTTETACGDIAVFIKENSASAVVIGLPRGLDGQETAQTALVRAFAQELATYTTIPQYFQDEALTSLKAHEELQNKGVRYTKEDVDALAATYILSDFLSEHTEV